MIPDTGISKIVGLLQIVQANGGKMQLDDISTAYSVELENLLLAVQGAQTLGLAKVEESTIVLNAAGKKLVSLEIPKRKKLIKKHLLTLEIFKVLSANPQAASRQAMQKKAVISILAKYFPRKDAEKQFKKMVEWGRYAQVVNYDANTESLTFDL